MPFDTLQKRLRGIVVFAITPFVERDGQTVVDEDGLRRNLEFLIERRIGTIVVCGGTGELFVTSHEEQSQVVRAAVEQVNGRAVVIAGVEGNLATSIARARAVEALGSDGILLFPDDATVEAGDKALLAYYRTIDQAVGIGLMPFRDSSGPSLDTVRRLAELPHVVTIKEESFDLSGFREVVLHVGHQVAVIGAGDEYLPYYLLAGGMGVATGLSNFLPNLYVEMYEAAQRWEYERVMALHARLAPLLRLRDEYGTTLLKAGMEAIGLAGGPTRLQPPRLPDRAQAALGTILESLRPSNV